MSYICWAEMFLEENYECNDFCHIYVPNCHNFKWKNFFHKIDYTILVLSTLCKSVNIKFPLNFTPAPQNRDEMKRNKL